MTAEAVPKRLTIKEYFEAELQSEVRHEYHGGVLVAMAGESRAHNRIALNIAKAIDAHVEGGPCSVYMEDVKVYVDILVKDLFYYPDVFVTCNPDDNDPYYCKDPKLIVEVLSPSNEDKDEVEKYLAYQRIAALEEYLIVSQDSEKREARLFRREGDWSLEPGDHVIGSGVVHLRSIDLQLPLAAIYRGLES